MFLIRALLVTQTIRFEAVAQHSLRLPAGSHARLGSRGPGVAAFHVLAADEMAAANRDIVRIEAVHEKGS
ncbi:hypothetical protein BZM26_24700 [Paraburkholderia strydomiana]|nr:hypothetical protein BZM26_24700 [Paraburkholderia strydomiana]